MIVCPNCQFRELVGALFCSECSTQLVFSDQPAPHMVTHPVEEEKPVYPNGAMRTGQPATGSLFTLRILDTGETIPVSGRDEVTLGRISDKQPIVPDIDLTPYRAYEQGVSRLHASLRVDQFAATVVDLGSANGTRLNGRRIAPYEPQVLKNGDILTLGRFKIQLLFFAPNPA